MIKVVIIIEYDYRTYIVANLEDNNFRNIEN